MARALAAKADEALRAKDFAAAAEGFQRADSLVHAPTLLVGLARADVGLGRWVAAHELYARVLREGVRPNAPEVFTRALADARAEIDALEPRIPSVTIEVRGATAATVTIDGAPVPSAALDAPRPIDPGKHLLRAEANGMAPAEVSVDLGEKAAQTVVLQLDPVHTAPPVLAPPVEALPSPALPVPSAPPDSAPAPARKIAGFVTLALGGAGLVVGAAAGGVALAKHGDLASRCPDSRCSLAIPQSSIDSYVTAGTVSTAGLVAGGALAVAGVVLVATAPRDPAKPVALLVGPARAAVVWRF